LERLGKFTGFMEPGWLCTDCFTSTGIPRSTKLRVSQVKCAQVRTKDNVFVTIDLSIQWKINGDPSKIPIYEDDDHKGDEHGHKGTHKPASQMTTEELHYAAVYQTHNPEAQIRDNTEQFFRIQVAQIQMDKLFDLGQTITRQCQQVLNHAMNHYGYIIKKVVIRDIAPEASVRNAMNDIVASEKERVAQITRADAEKIVQIKNAEADAEVSRLHGEGIAKQRYAIMSGLKKSVEIFDAEPSAVMSMLMMSQYTDMVKEAMHHSNHVSVTLTASPVSAIQMEDQIKGYLCQKQSRIHEIPITTTEVKTQKKTKKEKSSSSGSSD